MLAYALRGIRLLLEEGVEVDLTVAEQSTGLESLEVLHPGGNVQLQLSLEEYFKTLSADITNDQRMTY